MPIDTIECPGCLGTGEIEIGLTCPECHGTCRVPRCPVCVELLAALKGLMDAAVRPAECTHGAEPDYCDGCAFISEKAVGWAMSVARDAIAKAEAH